MTYEAELKRRKFMQITGRWLGWGFADGGPMTREAAGVAITVEGWRTPYDRFSIHERYADHGGDREATERAVIDRAIAAHEELENS